MDFFITALDASQPPAQGAGAAVPGVPVPTPVGQTAGGAAQLRVATPARPDDVLKFKLALLGAEESKPSTSPARWVTSSSQPPLPSAQAQTQTPVQPDHQALFHPEAKSQTRSQIEPRTQTVTAESGASPEAAVEMTHQQDLSTAVRQTPIAEEVSTPIEQAATAWVDGAANQRTALPGNQNQNQHPSQQLTRHPSQAQPELPQQAFATEAAPAPAHIQAHAMTPSMIRAEAAVQQGEGATMVSRPAHEAMPSVFVEPRMSTEPVVWKVPQPGLSAAAQKSPIADVASTPIKLPVTGRVEGPADQPVLLLQKQNYHRSPAQPELHQQAFASESTPAPAQFQAQAMAPGVGVSLAAVQLELNAPQVTSPTQQAMPMESTVPRTSTEPVVRMAPKQGLSAVQGQAPIYEVASRFISPSATPLVAGTVSAPNPQAQAQVQALLRPQVQALQEPDLQVSAYAPVQPQAMASIVVRAEAVVQQGEGAPLFSRPAHEAMPMAPSVVRAEAGPQQEWEAPAATTMPTLGSRVPSMTAALPIGTADQDEVVHGASKKSYLQDETVSSVAQAPVPEPLPGVRFVTAPAPVEAAVPRQDLRQVRDMVQSVVRTWGLRDLEALDAGREVTLVLDGIQWPDSRLIVRVEGSVVHMALQTQSPEVSRFMQEHGDRLQAELAVLVPQVRWTHGLQGADDAAGNSAVFAWQDGRVGTTAPFASEAAAQGGQSQDRPPSGQQREHAFAEAQVRVRQGTGPDADLVARFHGRLASDT